MPPSSSARTTRSKVSEELRAMAKVRLVRTVSFFTPISINSIIAISSQPPALGCSLRYGQANAKQFFLTVYPTYCRETTRLSPRARRHRHQSFWLKAEGCLLTATEL